MHDLGHITNRPYWELCMTLVSPLDNQPIALPFTVNAQMTSDVSWVNFYLDGKHLRSSPPLSFLIDPAPIVPGPHRASVTGYGGTGTMINTAAATIFVGDSSSLVGLRAMVTGSTTVAARDHVRIPLPRGTSPGDLLVGQIALRSGTGGQVTAPVTWSCGRGSIPAPPLHSFYMPTGFLLLPANPPITLGGSTAAGMARAESRPTIGPSAWPDRCHRGKGQRPVQSPHLTLRYAAARAYERLLIGLLRNCQPRRDYQTVRDDFPMELSSSQGGIDHLHGRPTQRR
jgi:hypothetical protein